MQSKIQNPKSKILIVGAGPAGASAAIRLANFGFDVTLIEREKFPRHKLCGEFISPECFEHFNEIGVLEKMLTANGERISETVFYEPQGKSVSVSSQWFEGAENALGLSRAAMDFYLLERAKQAGVKVLEETSVTNLLFEKGTICGVKAKNKAETFEIFADLTIDATGRAGILGKLAEKEFSRNQSLNQTARAKAQKPKTKNQFVGFKAHLKNVAMNRGRCEIYFFRGGYGGLNYVENGIANHCFLIKADVVRECGGDVEKILEKVIFQNVRARETLQNAVTVFDWLTVAIDKFGTKNLNPARGLIAVGDAGAFIDPFTGSGMLTAMESSAILAECIRTGKSSFSELSVDYERQHQGRFSKRLRVAGFLRRAAFEPFAAKSAIAFLSFGQKPLKLLAKATRPQIIASDE